MAEETEKSPALAVLISIGYFFAYGFLLYALVAVPLGAALFAGPLKAYVSSLTQFNYTVSIVHAALGLGGAVYFILLRKEALYIFLGKLIFGITVFIYLAVSTSGIIYAGSSAVVGFVLFNVIPVSVVVYAFSLRAREILK